MTPPPPSSDVSLPTDGMIEAGRPHLRSAWHEDIKLRKIYLAMRSKEPVAVEGLVERITNLRLHDNSGRTVGCVLGESEIAAITALSQSSVSGNETEALNDLVVRITEHAIMELDADEENTLQIEAFGAAVEKEIAEALAIKSPEPGVETVERVAKAIAKATGATSCRPDIARAVIKALGEG